MGLIGCAYAFGARCRAFPIICARIINSRKILLTGAMPPRKKAKEDGASSQAPFDFLEHVMANAQEHKLWREPAPDDAHTDALFTWSRSKDPHRRSPGEKSDTLELMVKAIMEWRSQGGSNSSLGNINSRTRHESTRLCQHF